MRGAEVGQVFDLPDTDIGRVGGDPLFHERYFFL